MTIDPRDSRCFANGRTHGHSDSQPRKLVLTDRDQENVTDWRSLVDSYLAFFLPTTASKLSIPKMPYEGQCLCKGCKVFVDGEPRFKVRSGRLLALGKLVDDDTHRAWEPATARIVELAAVPQLLMGSF